MTRQNELDEALTRRLTEIMSSAGVDSSRASLEVLYLLPREFLRGYAELFERALKLGEGGGGARGGEGELEKRAAGRAVDKGKRPMLGGGSGAKRYKEYWVVKDEGALNLKTRVDKRLRGLGREVMLELSEGKDSEGSRIRCGRCGRIMSKDWNFCAGCGNHRPVGGE
jgi:hypothetical protein